jgi:hypothetical protein
LNKTYTVQVGTTVDGGTWDKLADVEASATNRLVRLTDAPSGTSGYYRLVTPRQE